MKLFNHGGNGAAEIVSVLGMIDQDLDWSKWEPILPLALRDVSAIVGLDVVLAIDKAYHEHMEKPEDDRGELPEYIRLAQQATAMFAWLKMIPTLDAQHGTAGRGKHLGENEHGMTALEQYKDEENIRSMAYEAVDALVAELDSMAEKWWMESSKKKLQQALLIQSKELFDQFYQIGSHRLFLILTPMMREVQDREIIPVVGLDRMTEMLQVVADESAKAEDEQYREAFDLVQKARRPVALLTMKLAIERLPVEVLPNGVVQVQQTGMVKDRQKAERQARLQVAQDLQRDADAFLAILTDAVQRYKAAAAPETEPGDIYIEQPLVHTTGMTF